MISICQANRPMRNLCLGGADLLGRQRMLHLDLDGKYADILELALFNRPHLRFDRERRYSMPIRSKASARQSAGTGGAACPCCTMNVSRLVASVGGYFVSTSPTGLALHLYGGISTRAGCRGREVTLKEKSNYPWSGDIKVHVNPEQ